MDELSNPMRIYINKNVLPIVMQGLLDTCKNCKDDDPIDYLAEYFFTHYQEVKQSDAGVGGDLGEERSY